jgi:hypothetical protein
LIYQVNGFYPHINRFNPTTMVNSNYRIDIELVDADPTKLAQMQAKLNQWITKQELIKYQTSVVGNKIMFEIVRVKQ